MSRRFLRGTCVALAALAFFTPTVRAQSKGRVITPPRPADSARARASGNAPTDSARPAPAIPRSPVLDSIRETVFRNLLERDRAGLSTLSSAFCLGLSADDFKKPANPTDRADPPDDMLRRVYTPRTPARKASSCTFSMAGSRDKLVPGRALLYNVGAIRMLSPTRAEVGAGYYYDGFSSAGYTFTVERTDSTWVVRQWRMEWTATSP